MDFSSYKIIFFGSSEFGIPTINLLLKNRWHIALIITQTAKPKGRGYALSPTPIGAMAKKEGLPVLETENLRDEKVLKHLKKIKTDLAVVASFGLIIPAEILKLVRLGFLNLHPSLLPKYRGATPIQAALINGEERTGVTLMLVDEKLDHGPILSQKEVAILDDDDYVSLERQLSQVGAELLLETLPGWITGSIKPRAQDDRQATFTKILTKEDGKINWSRSAENINSLVRAYNPWPGSWTLLNDLRIKILRAHPTTTQFKIGKGQIKFNSSKILVGCGNDSVLEILELQPAGKRKMTAQEFAAGYSRYDGQYFK